MEQTVQDSGNPLLTPQPYRLDLGTASDENGIVTGVVTMRTSSASVTVYPNADQLDNQADMLHQLAESIRAASTRLVAPHPGVIAAINGQRQ